ncbi:MAG: esterase-like activity of phytase family protein [Telluria sp.]
MQIHVTLAFCGIAASLLLSGCGGSVKAPPERSVASLKLIGQQILPRRMAFQGTVVGGMSGIDYDAANQRYVLMSDDRTATDSANAPRFYSASLTFSETAFSGAQLLSTVTMKQPDGSPFQKVPSASVADPESVRIDPASGNLVWTSEGDRSLTTTPQRIINPFIREMRPDGTHVREYALPAMFRMSASETGPRGNLAFEGLSFTPDGTRTVVITEGPLFGDGPTPTTTTGAVARVTVFDKTTGTALAQYAYPVDKVQVTPVPATAFSVSGATEILAVTNTKFLVLERSFSVGVVGNQVRLYEIDLSQASNVLTTAALAPGAYTPVSKRLVLDFETLKTQLGGIANLEGITFGPKLANGHDSLVVVADDNFPAADSTTDRNQILVFEVIP